MKKKLILALVLSALTAQFAGCSSNTAKEDVDSGSSSAQNSGGAQSDTSSDIAESSVASGAESDISSVEVPDTSSSESDTSSDTPDTPGASEPENSSSPESSSQTESTAPEETSPDPVPAWNETETSGDLYVNTDLINSRIYAIQGSTVVKQYRLNDKVTVVAKTDTNYYKLEDGTFIHCDYLSKNKEYIPEDYVSETKNGYRIERINGITYVDGLITASKTYTLPRSYDPGVQPEAAAALKKMQAAAAAEGLSLYVISGYRSYAVQEAVYARWCSIDGKQTADTYSARPGHSDHQTGFTFDLNSTAQSFANTAEGKWLAEHCAEYGFIIRYPKGKEQYTGYIYEPWHVRYIGEEKAKLITESGLSVEEYYGITSSYDDCETE